MENLYSLNLIDCPVTKIDKYFEKTANVLKNLQYLDEKTIDEI